VSSQDHPAGTGQVSDRTGDAATDGTPAARPGPHRPPSGRDRWFDLLRAVALTRVIVYHMFSVGWLSLAFPAIGVMFALAGSLMARSVDRSATRAVATRLRRLLPALWLLAAVVVPAMFWVGWSNPPAWPRLLTWLVPIAQPPGNAWAEPATEVLWYLVTYLWLVLLSPAGLWLFRRWPVVALLLPLAVLIGLQLSPYPLNDTVDDVITNVATFGACWVVGFAHRDGSLRRVPLPLLIPLATASVIFGVAWALTHPAGGPIDLNDIPLGQAFFSLGIVLLLMRAAPPMGWLSRVRPLDRLVTALNARAVTVYLWHNPAIAVAFVVGDSVAAYQLGTFGYFVVTLILLVAIVLLVGWVEDLAAGRPPRLIPWKRTARHPAPTSGKAPDSAPDVHRPLAPETAPQPAE
jgi:peptidoglycan/LPS O-acetylase OafA/YrhL